MYLKRTIGDVNNGAMLEMKASITDLNNFTIGLNIITITICNNSVNHHVVKFNDQTNHHILFRGALLQNMMMIRIRNGPTH